MSGTTGGIDPTTITPPDAVAALRSFPRRWHSALSLVADDPAADDLVRRPAGDSWSALAHAWYVADHLASTREHIRRARLEDEPTLEGPGAADGHETGIEDSLEAALRAIGDGARALADALEELGPRDWQRRATVDGGQLTILAMAQGAVAEAAHHLRGAERALAEGRRNRPG